jgi:uncharacterized protein (TIGR02271 family)
MTLRTLMLAGPARANELFARLAETSDGAVKTRERLFGELKAELELHTSLEEQHLFPVLRRNPETRALVADAIKDNRELRTKLAELDGLPKNDDAFPERLKELQKAFRQHARDDKRELLPAVQQALSEEQAQDVAERMEAGRAEAEQARQEEAEERRAQARQEREEAEAQPRREREEAEAHVRREREEAEARARQEREEVEAQARRDGATARAAEAEAVQRRTREAARQVADTAVRPMEVAAESADQVTHLVAGQGTRGTPAASLADLFLAPWVGAIRGLQGPAARGSAEAEEVIPLGEEVLEVGKRTANRGTARVHRYVVETQVEEQVSLQSERVVVERRRPVDDKVTGEVLTEMTVEVTETEEVPVVGKRTRLREEVVVRTERTQRVETVRGTVRRDEVDIQQPGKRRSAERLRAVDAER